MTKEEAVLFFPCSQNDNLLDIYEELLFEYKQFFLSKPIIKKVFLAKKNKMQKMHESFLVLGGEIINLKNKKIEIEYHFTDSILDTFNTYQKSKNILKSVILKCESVFELNPIIDEIIQLQSNYSECWGVFENVESENIIISKEIDPMNLLLAIQEFYKLGGFTFKDLHSKINISPILLINEAKRLSLCRKLEKNG